MKKYTHAWLAFMAIKRLDCANIPEELKGDAQSLVKWFHDYRDFVIEGAWYPDQVFKDMATSHIIKYRPDTAEREQKFKRLPRTMQCYNKGMKSPLYKKPFAIEEGNCADRCESIAHSIVDCFKILRTEERGNPISTTSNHIAMRFFILSHYIADCHMPLHCDCRSFSSGENIHGFIESEWDKQVKASYHIDIPNNRFFYDPQGYPLANKITPLVQEVENDIVNREFLYTWGNGNNNTWDYISAVSEYSYLMSYRLIPKEFDEKNLTKELYKSSEAYSRLGEYSSDILCDAVDSIARVWLHVWARYRKWAEKR
ncbi:MAG: hypothetical protein IKN11_08440 [Bacteroidales bacterium]|nr:hypothetical protein [Bacteroidales bacterium]